MLTSAPSGVCFFLAALTAATEIYHIFEQSGPVESPKNTRSGL